MTDPRKRRFAFVVALTMVRIPLILIFLAITIATAKPMGERWFAMAFGAMILSAITDLLDGWFARRFDVVTRFGGYFDPLTDKIFYLATLPTLVYLAAVNGLYLHAKLLLILTIVFLLRDQWVSFLRSIGAIYGRSGKANWSGKLRTLIAFPSICVFYYYLEAPRGWWLQVPAWIVYVLEIVGVGISLLSLWVYTVSYWPSLKREMSPSKKPPADSAAVSAASPGGDAEAIQPNRHE